MSGGDSTSASLWSEFRGLRTAIGIDGRRQFDGSKSDVTWLKVRRLRLPVSLWKRSGRRVKRATSTCSSHTAPCLHHAAHAAKDMRVCRVRVCRSFSNFSCNCACSHRPATWTGLIYMYTLRLCVACPAKDSPIRAQHTSVDGIRLTGESGRRPCCFRAR